MTMLGCKSHQPYWALFWATFPEGKAVLVLSSAMILLAIEGEVVILDSFFGAHNWQANFNRRLVKYTPDYI